MNAHSDAPQALAKAAYNYAKLGVPVLPLHSAKNGRCSCGREKCQSPGKHPRTKHGSTDASCDLDQVQSWWKQWPDANIGITTGTGSGIVVLDIDPQHSGETSLLDLEELHGPLSTSCTVATGGGGRHLYFECPEEGLRNSAGTLGPGLDMRGDGGYVVGPPSRHASGKCYEWIEGDPGQSSFKLSPLPTWLKQLSRPVSGASGGGSDGAGHELIAAGQRNCELTSLAGALRRRGMLSEEMLPALLEINRRRCVPPLAEYEVEQIVKSISRYPVDEVLPLTDVGNARRLVVRHGHDLRYCYPFKGWLVWDGRRWVRDETGEIYRRAKETVRAIHEEAAAEDDESRREAIGKHAFRSQRKERIEALIKLAQSDLPIRPADLDTNTMLLNVENGTIDLETGDLRPHSRDDYITKMALVTFDPVAKCPTWLAFLERVMDDKEALIDFLQRVVGYGLTGLTNEQCMFLFYGTGANGKTTFLEAIYALLGGYAQKTEYSTLLAKTHDGVRNDIARWPAPFNRFQFLS